MPIYKQTTEITNIDDLLSSVERDIEEVYFGDKNVFTVWAEYDGTLPATYSADGSTLADYRVYGSAGGVGDRTANLFDRNAADIEKNCYYNAENVRVPSIDIHNESGFIPVSPGEYTFSFLRKSGGGSFYVNFYDTSKNFVSNLSVLSGATRKVTITVQDYGYVRFNFADYFITSVMFGRGIDLSWVPYGYEVDMSVSDGNTPTITQIYIGSDPLGEGEYISYAEQKRIKTTSITSISASAPTTTITAVSSAEYIVENSATTQYVYESVNFALKLNGDVRFKCDLDVQKFSSFNKLYVGIRNAQNAYTYLIEVVDIGKTHIDFSVSNVSYNSYISILATYNRTNMGTYKYTLLNPELILTPPIDPPVPLPALPTVDGVTITDYAGQSAAVPSRFVAKYRKEGF